MSLKVQAMRLHVVAAKRRELELPIPPVRDRIVGEFRNGSSLAALGKKYEGIGRSGVEGCLRYALNELRRAA